MKKHIIEITDELKNEIDEELEFGQWRNASEYISRVLAEARAVGPDIDQQGRLLLHVPQELWKYTSEEGFFTGYKSTAEYVVSLIAAAGEQCADNSQMIFRVRIPDALSSFLAKEVPSGTPYDVSQYFGKLLEDRKRLKEKRLAPRAS